MNTKNFKKFLKDSGWNFNKHDIESIMDKELEKDPNEIDTELVDACLEFLTESNRKSTEIQKKSIKKIKFVKLFAAAIIIVLAVSLSLTAYAKANNINISDALVSWFSNYIVIDYHSKKDTKDTTSQPTQKTSETLQWENFLNENGFENLYLPRSFYSQNFSKPQLYKDETETAADFANDKFDIQIIKYNSEKDIMNREIPGKFKNSEKITVNNTDIYLFESTESKSTITYVSYKVGKTEYYIECNSDLATTKAVFSEIE